MAARTAFRTPRSRLRPRRYGRPWQTLPGATLWTFPGWDTPTTYTPAANSVVNLAAKWTFTYANDTIPPAGVYGATVANKGRVTYTATSS